MHHDAVSHGPAICFVSQFQRIAAPTYLISRAPTTPLAHLVFVSTVKSACCWKEEAQEDALAPVSLVSPMARIHSTAHVLPHRPRLLPQCVHHEISTHLKAHNQALYLGHRPTSRSGSFEAGR